MGVEYIRNGTVRQVHALKEVIVSAGTIGSAQLLMLSGIGPKQHLESLKVRKDSHDYIVSNMVWTWARKCSLIDGSNIQNVGTNIHIILVCTLIALLGTIG